MKTKPLRILVASVNVTVTVKAPAEVLFSQPPAGIALALVNNNMMNWFGFSFPAISQFFRGASDDFV